MKGSELTAFIWSIIVETASLLPILLSLSSSSLRASATSLQTSLTELEAIVVAALTSLWNWREAEWKIELSEENRLRERGEWVEIGPMEEGMERVLKPVKAKGKWRIGLLDVV